MKMNTMKTMKMSTTKTAMKTKYETLTNTEFKEAVRKSDPAGFIRAFFNGAGEKGTTGKEKVHIYDYDNAEDWYNQHVPRHGKHWKEIPPVAPREIPQPKPETIEKVRAAFSIDELRKACANTEAEWFAYYKKNVPMEYFSTPAGEYIYRRRKGCPILFVAHLDSVQGGRTVDDQREENGRIYCPVLDDRLGVYTALFLMPKLGIKADLLLCDKEERGASTAKVFAYQGNATPYKWIAEFDRKGEDVVTYGFTSTEWVAKLKERFDYGHGSFSDVAALTHLGCSGVNIGVGYYDYHAANAYFDFEMYLRQMARFVEFWEEHKDTHFEHKPAPPVAYTPPKSTSAYQNCATKKAEFDADTLYASAIAAPRWLNGLTPPPDYTFEMLLEEALKSKDSSHIAAKRIGADWSIAEWTTKRTCYYNDWKMLDAIEGDAIDSTAEKPSLLSEETRKAIWTPLPLCVDEAAPGICYRQFDASPIYSKPLTQVIAEPVHEWRDEREVGWTALHIHDKFNCAHIVFAFESRLKPKEVFIAACHYRLSDNRLQELKRVLAAAPASETSKK